MLRPISPESTDSFFYVAQPSNDPNPPRPNTPILHKSTEMSGNKSREMITKSSIAPHVPQIFTIDSDKKEPTMPFGFGRQLSIIPTDLNDLNLPPNPFETLATMALANHTEEGHDENYSPHSPEPSAPSPISTPPINFGTIEGWEPPHTTKYDNTFYSNDEPKRNYFLPSSPSPPPPPRKLKRKMSFGMSFPKRGGVSQYLCEACGQALPAPKDIPGSSSTNWKLKMENFNCI